MHTCTAFSRVPGFNTFHAHTTHKPHNPGSPPGNRACWGIMKNDEVPFFPRNTPNSVDVHLIFFWRETGNPLHNQYNQVDM